jgi:hypothetical protein
LWLHGAGARWRDHMRVLRRGDGALLGASTGCVARCACGGGREAVVVAVWQWWWL